MVIEVEKDLPPAEEDRDFMLGGHGIFPGHEEG